MEESAVGILIFIIFGITFFVYTIIARARHSRNMAMFVAILLRNITLRAKNASVYYVPPHDGPSFAQHRYSSPNFSCDCLLPVHYPEVAEDPRMVLATLSGFIGDISTDTRAALLATYPILGDKEIKQLTFSLGMSPSRHKGVRLRRGLYIKRITIIGESFRELLTEKMVLGENMLISANVDFWFQEVLAPTRATLKGA